MTMNYKHYAMTAVAVGSLFATACAGGKQDPGGDDLTAGAVKAEAKTAASLYERLGGVFAVAAVVDHFSNAVVENPIVGRESKNPALRAWHTKNIGHLPGVKFMRTLWVSSATGGPFQYVATKPGMTPLGLEEAHRELNISSAEFDEVAAELGRTLDVFKVPQQEKTEVLSAFAAHKGEVTAGQASATVGGVKASAEKTPPMASDASLYGRLGGIFAIAAVVDHFSNDVAANRIVGRESKNPALRAWSTENIGRLPGVKFMRTLWVANVAGGPFQFTATKPGATAVGLEEAHRALKISPEEFDEVAAELARTLATFKVPKRETTEVLTAFAAHKTEVIAGYVADKAAR